MEPMQKVYRAQKVLETWRRIDSIRDCQIFPTALKILTMLAFGWMGGLGLLGLGDGWVESENP